MTGEPAKKFHGFGIGPLSKILAVNGFASKFSFCLQLQFKFFQNSLIFPL
jgi:hypothetical protein